MSGAPAKASSARHFLLPEHPSRPETSARIDPAQFTGGTGRLFPFDQLLLQSGHACRTNVGLLPSRWASTGGAVTGRPCATGGDGWRAARNEAAVYMSKRDPWSCTRPFWSNRMPPFPLLQKPCGSDWRTCSRAETVESSISLSVPKHIRSSLTLAYLPVHPAAERDAPEGSP